MFFQYLLAMSGRSLRSRRLDTPLEAVHHVGDGNFGRETPRSSVVEIVEAFSTPCTNQHRRQSDPRGGGHIRSSVLKHRQCVVKPRFHSCLEAK